MAFLAALFLASVSSAKDLRVLFIGNSLTYWNDLPVIVAAMAKAGHQDEMKVETVAFPDFSLEDHWNRGDALKVLQKQKWDFVVLQQGPAALEESRQLLVQYSSLFATQIRKQEATPVLYSVWPSHNRKFDFDRSIDSYRIAATKSGSILIPAGRAWVIAWSLDPALDLYAADGLHPTKYGSYLAALVFYEVLFKSDCTSLPSRVEQIVIEKNIAKILQQAAHEAVQTAN